MFEPKKMKHRKWNKGKMSKVATRGNYTAFGVFALKSMDPAWITGAQLESCRKAITKVMKRKGKLWIRIFPNKPVTSKGSEVPLGGGKGAVSHYVFPVEPGRVLFELDGVDEVTAREAFQKATNKLPIRTKFLK